jgi:hypothetical protein
MMSRQLPFQLAVKPLAGFMILADRTVTVPTGTKADMDLTASSTIIYDYTTGGWGSKYGMMKMTGNATCL